MGKTTCILLYIISTHYGTFYTGITNNLIRRWKEHNLGQSSYLRKFEPKEVIHVEIFNSRKQAARKERKIKNMGAKKYLLKLKFRA